MWVRIGTGFTNVNDVRRAVMRLSVEMSFITSFDVVIDYLEEVWG